MDTGSGHDIVNLCSLPHQIRRTVAYRGFREDFSTANGLVAADQHVSLSIPALKTLNDQVHGILCLKDCPDILSVGWRCQEEGFAFYWPPGADHAFLIPPEAKPPIIAKGSEKKWVKCPADRYIPYLQDDCNPELLNPIAAAQPIANPSSDLRLNHGCRDGGDAETAEVMQPSVHNAVNPFTEGGASGSADPAPAEEDQLVEFTNTELLKQQACSIEHLATHATFNQYCQTCREAKASRAHKRNKKKQRERAREKTGEVDPSDGRSTMRFGDQVTGDYLLQRRNEVKNEAFNTDHPGSKAAIVLWDMGTDCLFIAPTATRSEQETRKAMTDFFGPTDEVRSFYSDNAPELKKAARSLEYLPPHLYTWLCRHQWPSRR